MLLVIDNAATVVLKNASINSTDQVDTFNSFTPLVLSQMFTGEKGYQSLLSNLRFEAKVATSNSGAIYTVEPPLTSLEIQAGIANNNISFNLGTI